MEMIGFSYKFSSIYNRYKQHFVSNLLIKAGILHSTNSVELLVL